MATTPKKDPLSPNTAAGRLRQRAHAAARARLERESIEGRRRREVLEVLHGDSQTGLDPGDLVGPALDDADRSLAHAAFCADVAVSVTRLESGNAKEIGEGTLLYGLVIGEAVQVAIPHRGVLRTTAVRSVSALGPRAVQIVTRRSTYRLRLRTEP